VTSNRDATVVSVLKEQCERLDSPFYGLENDFFAEDIRKVEEGYLYDYRLSDHGKEVLIRGIRVNSPVYEQIENTCVAITAALLLRDVFHMISPAGIAAALDRFSPPGRFMWLSGNPVMIYDPAHNYGAVSSLISAVTRLYPGKSVVVIITFMRDKDYRAIIPLITASCREVLYSRLDDPRSYSPDGLDGIISPGNILSSEDELLSRLNAEAGTDTVFIFTGSFRLFQMAESISKKFRWDKNSL
jgi:dihydrofolate synthase/folylpolyglutamate synthase